MMNVELNRNRFAPRFWSRNTLVDIGSVGKSFNIFHSPFNIHP